MLFRSGDRICLDDDASISEKGSYLDLDTDRWIQAECKWALEEAAESASDIPDLFDGQSALLPSDSPCL